MVLGCDVRYDVAMIRTVNIGQSSLLGPAWLLAKTWGAIGVVLLAAVAAHAAVDEPDPSENPYNVFVVRNPFNIRPAPVPTNAPPPVVEAPKLEVKLTGITAFGKRRAYFQVTEQGKKAEPEFWVLEPNGKQGDFEVLEIDEVNSRVRVRQDGVETLMTFLSHGIAAPAGSGGAPNVAGGAPGASGVAPIVYGGSGMGGAGRVGTVTPLPGVPPPPNAGGFRTIPSRSPRLQPSQGGTALDSRLADRYGMSGGGNPTLPTVRAPEPPAHNLTPEEQVLLMELQKVSEPNREYPPTPGLPGTTMPGPPSPGGPGVPMPGQPPGVPVLPPGVPR